MGLGSTWHKAAAFALAVLSRGLKAEKVDAATKEKRWRSCHGGPCPHRAYSEEGQFHYCDSCGCGESTVARLSAVGSGPDTPLHDPSGYDKLDYPYLECPIRAEGFSNAVQ